MNPVLYLVWILSTSQPNIYSEQGRSVRWTHFLLIISQTDKKKIKRFSTREECTIFLLQELQYRKDFCCKRNLSHLVCGVKNRKPQSTMSFFRCLSPHPSTCPLVPGTHSVHYLQSAANTCDKDSPAHIPRAHPLSSLSLRSAAITCDKDFPAHTPRAHPLSSLFLWSAAITCDKGFPAHTSRAHPLSSLPPVSS